MELTAELLRDFDPRDYLKALIAVARVDGVLPVERDYVRMRATLLGVDPAPLWADDGLDLSQLAQSASEVTRRTVIRDCVVLASIDGFYSQRERSKVLAIAARLGVDEDAVDRIEDWLRRYWDLMDEAEEILSGFDAPRYVAQEQPPHE